MKKNTKLDIIKVATKLFNERGYNDVSTQNIADAVGISKGNLSYHFKRKEDIIEAVVEEMHRYYVKPKAPTTVVELNAFFLRVQKVYKKNAFYFWHYTQLAQISKKISTIQNTVIENNYTLFSKAFKQLMEEGSLQREEYLGQQEQIIQSIMLICIYWTPHSRLVESIGTNCSFSDCIWAILYPLLTDQGKIQYKALKDTFLQK